MLTITHDIKAPVGSIMGYIDLMTRLLKEDRQRFYLQNMKSSARHLLDLVSSLLDYHKLESNKMEVNHVPFNPSQLFQTIYTSFQPLAEKRTCISISQGDEKLNRFYMGDPFRVRQIADNLLSNALKFTHTGSITLRIRLNDGKFQFSVTDTGSGMSESEQKTHVRRIHPFAECARRRRLRLGTSHHTTPRQPDERKYTSDQPTRQRQHFHGEPAASIWPPEIC